MKVCVLDGRGSLALKTIGFGIGSCFKYHLLLITSLTLGKLLIIVCGAVQFLCLNMVSHSLFSKYWLDVFYALDPRDITKSKKTRIPALLEFPFFWGSTYREV